MRPDCSNDCYKAILRACPHNVNTFLYVFVQKNVYNLETRRYNEDPIGKERKSNVARFTDETKEIGARIKQRREELGWSQDELARRCGYAGRSSINKIEKGANAMSMDIVQRIAAALDVKVSWLFGFQEATTSDQIRFMIDKLTPEQQKTVLKMVTALVMENYDDEEG